MNKITYRTLDIIFYMIAFVVIQLLTNVIFGVVSLWHEGQTWAAIVQALAHGTMTMPTKMLVANMVASSLLTIILFKLYRWAPVSRVWLASHPWTTLAWVGMLAVGTILPSEWIIEHLPTSMPSATEQLLQSIMKEPTGYLAVGILGPVAEEMVFRGAVLRTLLNLFSQKSHWWAILISAVLFGAIHFNTAQFAHALPIGLFWKLRRTAGVREPCRPRSMH